MTEPERDEGEDVEILYNILKYDSKKQKGNSGYLNKRQLKKKKKNQPREHSVRRKSDADQNPHHAAAGIGGGSRRRRILQSEWMEEKNNVTINCIWGGFKYAVCFPVVSFVS